MKLKEKVFEYLCKRQEERKTRFPHFDKPLKILVIYESDVLERNDAMKSIRQDLLKRQMDVTMWGYVEKKEITSLVLPQSRILGIADYNWFGKPRDYVLKDLQSVHYDLLIDLTTHSILPLRYLAMYADADFKVGLNLGEGIHDMLLSLPDFTPEQGAQAAIEATWLYSEIMKFVSTVKSLD
jgi:hypothetical protein